MRFTWGEVLGRDREPPKSTNQSKHGYLEMLSYNLIVTLDSYFFNFSCQRAAPASSDTLSFEPQNT